jgi:Chlorite dismutase
MTMQNSPNGALTDQDFVVAFDSDYPQEFLDRVGRLRYTEASVYTQRGHVDVHVRQGASRRDHLAGRTGAMIRIRFDF